MLRSTKESLTFENLEKENIFFQGSRKRKKIFGEGKYFFAKEKKNRKENAENV